jgi:hypothetical protein
MQSVCSNFVALSNDTAAVALVLLCHLCCRFPLTRQMSFAAALLCKSARLTPRDLQHHLTGIHAGELAHLIQQLLLANYMYSADD